MLVFERIRADLWQAIVRIACNVLMQVFCDSGFLVMGEEMHLFCRFASIAFPSFCVNRFPGFPAFRAFRAFLFFAWSGYSFKRLAIWPGTGPLARVSRDALLYSINYKTHFCFICLHCSNV